jgi:hypothetical protein
MSETSIPAKHSEAERKGFAEARCGWTPGSGKSVHHGCPYGLPLNWNLASAGYTTLAIRESAVNEAKVQQSAHVRVGIPRPSVSAEVVSVEWQLFAEAPGM